MAIWTFYVSLLCCSSSVLAAQFGRMLAPPQERSVAQFGGWALAAGTCPSDTTVCGGLWCCPNSLTCVHTGNSDTSEACCPTSTDCTIDLQSAPVCADSSWVLWMTGNPAGTAAEGDTGYVCCLPGQTAQLNGDGADAVCVDAGTPIPASLIGTLIGGGSPTATAGTAASTASAGSSSGGSPASSFASSPVTTSAAEGPTTTASSSPAPASASSSSNGASVVASGSPSATASASASASPTPAASKNVAAENAVFSLGPLAACYGLGFLSWLLL